MTVHTLIFSIRKAELSIEFELNWGEVRRKEKGEAAAAQADNSSSLNSKIMTQSCRVEAVRSVLQLRRE